MDFEAQVAPPVTLMSPLPATFASTFPVAFMLTSPEPAIDTVAFVAVSF
jgi:hypothetical protein